MQNDTHLPKTAAFRPAARGAGAPSSSRSVTFLLDVPAPAMPADDELLFLCPDRDGAVGFVPSRR